MFDNILQFRRVVSYIYNVILFVIFFITTKDVQDEELIAKINQISSPSTKNIYNYIDPYCLEVK